MTERSEEQWTEPEGGGERSSALDGQAARRPDLEFLRLDRQAFEPAPRSLRKPLIAVAILLAVVASGSLVVRVIKGARLAVVTTEVRAIGPTPSSAVLSASGYLVPERRTRIEARVAGRVARVLVRRGQRVAEGDTLFVLDSQREAAMADVGQHQLEAARQRARAAGAALEAERAELAELQQRLSRQRMLSEQGATPRAEVIDLTARFASQQKRQTAAALRTRAASSEVEVAASELQARSLAVQDMTVRAPFAGVVVSELPSVGEYLDPQVGNGSRGAVELADFATLLAEVEVSEARLALLQPDAPAEIVLDAFPSRRLRGAVSAMAPRIDRAKATVTVRVHIQDPIDALLPDMAVRVQFLSRPAELASLERSSKLVVSPRAVVLRGAAPVVFVVEGERVRAQPVTTGARTADGVELTRGPAAGTIVVEDPPPALADGNLIKRKEAR